MKNGKGYLWGVGVAFLLVMLVNLTAPDQVTWKESFSKYKHTPYGAYATYELLQDIFPDQAIDVSHQSPYELEKDYLEDRNIIMVDRTLNFERNDSYALLQMVQEGNNVFLATRYFYGELADSLNINTGSSWHMLPPDSIVTHFMFESEQLNELDTLVLNRSSLKTAFRSYDTTNTQVLARNIKGEAVFIKTAFGEGHFYLCTLPLAFTNFHSLNGEQQFAEIALSHLPVNPVIWDEYYKWGRIGNRSPLRFLLGETPLRWALYITVAMAFLFLVFGSKREQRPVPILTPLRNATRDFMNTVGRLYMQKGDHADLARKMCAYLRDEIRKRCYATNIHDDQELIERMAERYALPIEKVMGLFARMQYMENAKSITQEELLEFSEIVESNKRILRNGRG